MSEHEIFHGKTLSDLFEDIYDNTSKKRKQLDELLKGLIPYLNNASDIEVVGPIIKDLMDVKVKNDDSLVKIATIAQRIINNQPNSEGTYGLTDQEKEQLLSNMQSQIQDLSQDAQDALDKIEND